jgi:hypothetical protein
VPGEKGRAGTQNRNPNVPKELSGWLPTGRLHRSPRLPHSLRARRTSRFTDRSLLPAPRPLTMLAGTRFRFDRRPIPWQQGGKTTMVGLEGAVLVPILILGSAAILYWGLLRVRDRQVAARSSDESPGD